MTVYSGPVFGMAANRCGGENVRAAKDRQGLLP